jgi:hypothetical protein
VLSGRRVVCARPLPHPGPSPPGTHLDGGGTSGSCGKGAGERPGDGHITTRHGQAGAAEKGVGEHGGGVNVK